MQHHNHSNKRHKWIELLRQMEGGWKRLPTPLDAKERQIYLHQYPACGKKWQTQKCDQEPMTKLHWSCLSFSQHYNDKEDAVCEIEAGTPTGLLDTHLLLNDSIEQEDQVRAGFEVMMEQFNNATPATKLLIGGTYWNYIEQKNSSLYTQTFVFSILFPMHFLRCHWQGEFVLQSRASK